MEKFHSATSPNRMCARKTNMKCRQEPEQHKSCRRRAAPSTSMLVLGASCVVLLHGSTSVQAQTADQITALAPSTDVEAGQDFTLKWSYAESGGTTGDLTGFNVGLRSCAEDGSDCAGTVASCGTDYADLCTLNDGVCMDSDGSYDVTMPSDAPAGQYAIMVSLDEDPSVASCTAAFNGTEPETGLVAADEPSLTAVTPVYVEAGSPFTAQWVYDDGAGAASGNFEVNLYACGDAGACDDGGCGTLSNALCGDAGCFDPGTGDYDVVVPATVTPGKYKLQIKNMADQTASCSDSSFYVVEEGGETPTLPPSEAPIETPSPVAPPTAAPVRAPSTSPVVPPSGAPAAAPSGAPAAAATDQPVAVVSPTPASVTSSSTSSSPGTPGTPPSPVPSKAACDPTVELEFTYTVETTKLPLVTVSHVSGDRDEGGCLTLTKLYDWLAAGPTDVPEGLLYTMDVTTEISNTDMTTAPTGMWLLSTSVEVTNGVTMAIKGTAIDGDCDELKLSSTVKKWYRIMGHGGHLDIDSTVIKSWDASKSLEHIFKASTDGKDARSYIACVSEVAFAEETCDGTAQNDMGECRMDIVDSELGYLGYDSTEAYGVTWKVRGLCTDLSNLDLFDSVRVYGDMTGSDIHHMWYGMYSYGHLGGVWTDNIMRDNHVYGFDPHDDSDYLTIARNTVYGNGNHGIIASKRCDHLLVADNIVYENEGSGIMLHKSCDDSIVTGNACSSNFDAGISLVETSRCDVSDNTFEYNRWGFRVILGSTDNVFDSNIVTENTYSDIYVYYGATEEVPEVSPFTGVNVNNVFSNNVVTHTVKTVVDIEDSDGAELSSNSFSGEDGHFVFLRSTETHVVSNTGDAASGLSDDITSSCFTTQSDRLPLC